MNGKQSRSNRVLHCNVPVLLAGVGKKIVLVKAMYGQPTQLSSQLTGIEKIPRINLLLPELNLNSVKMENI